MRIFLLQWWSFLRALLTLLSLPSDFLLPSFISQLSNSFYMIGGVNEAVEKAAKMAKEMDD